MGIKTNSATVTNQDDITGKLANKDKLSTTPNGSVGASNIVSALGNPCEKKIYDNTILRVHSERIPILASEIESVALFNILIMN